MTLNRRVLAFATTLLVGAVIAGCSSPAFPGPNNSTGPGTASGPAAGAALRVAGYVVPWDRRSVATVGAGVLTGVSPVWYQPTEAGAVVFASGQAESTVATVNADALAHGLTVAPAISNARNGRWDGALVARLVSDPGRRAAHVAAIVELVRSRHLPAIDIDYESLPASSRTAYSAFIAELAGALHKVPARLSVTLHAKTAEPGDWSGAQAQDWHAIGAAADEVRVMAYDYSHSASPPGPIAPPSWVDQVLKLATRLIPAERVVLGVPTYGYDWVAGGDGQPVQWADVQKIAAQHAVRQQRDKATSSPWLRYTDADKRQHTVWYEDAASLTAKLAVAKRYGVKQVVLWRLGGEDPGVWAALRAAG